MSAQRGTGQVLAFEENDLFVKPGESIAYDLYQSITPVQYRGDRIIIDNNFALPQDEMLYTKGKIWSYEEEVRQLFISNEFDMFRGLPADNSNSYIYPKFHNNKVIGVILGAKFHENKYYRKDLFAIREAIRENGMNIDFAKTEISKKSYKLEFKCIDILPTKRNTCDIYVYAQDPRRHKLARLFDLT